MEILNPALLLLGGMYIGAVFTREARYNMRADDRKLIDQTLQSPLPGLGLKLIATDRLPYRLACLVIGGRARLTVATWAIANVQAACVASKRTEASHG
jgi:hypothetical protein